MRRTPSCDIYIDGASRGNPGPAGIGAVFFTKADDLGSGEQTETQMPQQELSRYIGETTNNVAEYLALIYALQAALQAGQRRVAVKTDSELLARQVNGVYKVRDRQLRLLHDLAQHLIRGFDDCTIAHIPREQNQLADRLAGRAAATGLRQDQAHEADGRVSSQSSMYSSE